MDDPRCSCRARRWSPDHEPHEFSSVARRAETPAWIHLRHLIVALLRGLWFWLQGEPRRCSHEVQQERATGLLYGCVRICCSSSVSSPKGGCRNLYLCHDCSAAYDCVESVPDRERGDVVWRRPSREQVSHGCMEDDVMRPLIIAVLRDATPDKSREVYAARSLAQTGSARRSIHTGDIVARGSVAVGEHITINITAAAEEK